MLIHMNRLRKRIRELNPKIRSMTAGFLSRLECELDNHMREVVNSYPESIDQHDYKMRIDGHRPPHRYCPPLYIVNKFGIIKRVQHMRPKITHVGTAVIKDMDDWVDARLKRLTANYYHVRIDVDAFEGMAATGKAAR